MKQRYLIELDTTENRIRIWDGKLTKLVLPRSSPIINEIDDTDIDGLGAFLTGSLVMPENGELQDFKNWAEALETLLKSDVYL